MVIVSALVGDSESLQVHEDILDWNRGRVVGAGMPDTLRCAVGHHLESESNYRESALLLGIEHREHGGGGRESPQQITLAGRVLITIWHQQEP